MGSGIAQEKVMNAVSGGQSATVYSSSVLNRLSKGYASVLVSSTAGSITISEQVSWDNVNFFDAVDTQGNALGSVYTALTVNTGKYIVFAPVMAPYIRFKVIENNSAATVVTLIYLFVESV